MKVGQKKLAYRVRINSKAEDKLFTSRGHDLVARRAVDGYHVWRLDPNEPRCWLIRCWKFKKKRVTAQMLLPHCGRVIVLPWTKKLDNVPPLVAQAMCDFLGLNYEEWRHEQFIRKALTLPPGTAMMDPELDLIHKSHLSNN